MIQLIWARGYFQLRQFSDSPITGPTTLFTLNTRCDSSSRDTTAETVLSLEPDIVIIQDIGERMREEFTDQGIDGRYAHQAFFPSSDPSTCGIAIYSKIPMEQLDISTSGHAAVLSQIDATEVLLFATDNPSPTKDLEGWKSEMNQLGHAAAASDLPVVVVGDFNAVNEHFPLREIKERAYLHDVTSGLGWFPTWETGNGFIPLIQIDHVLASPGITADRAKTLTVGRNAHRALLVRLQTD